MEQTYLYSMKFVFFCSTDYPTVRLKNITFFEDGNFEDPDHPGINTRTFCAYPIKNNGELEYFSSSLCFSLLFDYQTYVSIYPEILSSFVSSKNHSIAPETGNNKGNLMPCKKNKLNQEAYEQLYSIKSYNNHYEEPEVVKCCRYLQREVSRSAETNSVAEPYETVSYNSSCKS